ncbi:putative protein tyrosine phosphatase [Roseiarcus fermentans]|uniref:Tyrosine specific protein phosphatases domain-containing protein n=1 Tax=Roseiarcus fermentans TaxID=1473586 RepID=A0A366EF16_9HYPH|nr:putative protein tyrosine phosphatase [Roseiarcus fermentans]
MRRRRDACHIATEIAPLRDQGHIYGCRRLWESRRGTGGKIVIIVSSLRQVEAVMARYAPVRSLSLLAPWQTIIFETDRMPRDRVVLAFNDVAASGPGLVAPDEATVAAIVEFGRRCRSNDVSLVHCWMGVSRSPAAAYIIACERAPGEERAIAEDLRRRSPTAAPNRLLVALADDYLARGGRMVDAVDGIGRGCAFDGDPPPLFLPLDGSLGGGAVPVVAKSRGSPRPA